MNIKYPLGIDCVWIAVDCTGHLGAFVTGGVAPIPCITLNAKHIAIEDIEERICELPQISNVKLLVRMLRPDDFIAMAERGFFVYDWTDVHRSSGESIHAYELIAIPENPITISDLPTDIMESVSNIKFNNIVYANVQKIDVQSKFECMCNLD